MTECIEWTKCITARGYGQFRIGRQRMYAHRRAWEIVHGPIPKDMCICHHCDNRKCFNVNHLFLGTKADNNADKMAKGRHRSLSGEQHPMSKLSFDQVCEIRTAFSLGCGQLELAKLFGVGQTMISRIVLGHVWVSHAN